MRANYTSTFNTVSQLETLSEAAATVQVCPTLGTYLAAGLEQLFGVPQVKSPPPFGLAATEAWLRDLGQTVGKAEEAEAVIKTEREKVAAPLADLRSKLKGVRAVVAAGGVHGHSLMNVLGDLEIEVVKGLAWHHEPRLDHASADSDSLSQTVRDYGDMEYSVCHKQSFEIVNMLSRIRPDLFVVRHKGMAIWGAKLGIPTVLVSDENFGLGHQGLIDYGQHVLAVLANRTFTENLSRHTRLPYSEWWMNEDHTTFLGVAT